MLQGSKRAATQARALRKQMSLSEVLLWRRLKGRPAGLKFRPQHPAGEYILGFYCHQARTAIEIDAISHDMGDRPERDQQRNDWLASCGSKVFCIPAVDVLRNPEAMADSIITICCAAILPSTIGTVIPPLGEPLRSP